MAGTQFTLNEIVALINEELPEGVPALTSATMMNRIYGSVTPTAAVTNAQLVELINAALNNDNIVAGVARIAGIRTNEFISELINSHNPYTTDNMTDMNIYTGNPDFSQWADNKTNQIEVEVDGPYTMPKEWYFKGLPQHINKALRIKYRYKAVNLGERPQRAQIKPDHWITAYMLIGYEDGGA
jgi:hypothetical protein